MNDEIKEILDKWKDKDGTIKVNLSLGGIRQLEDYITNLQQKIEQYENPDDMTLFYMWLDAKAKDKMKELEQENERLKETNVYCNRTDCIGRIKDSRKYDSVYQEKEDYKSRCEKAVKYIDTNFCIENRRDLKEVVNILQNGSEKNEC